MCPPTTFWACPRVCPGPAERGQAGLRGIAPPASPPPRRGALLFKSVPSWRARRAVVHATRPPASRISFQTLPASQPPFSKEKGRRHRLPFSNTFQFW